MKKKKEKEKKARWQSFEKVTSYHDISKKQPPINNRLIHLHPVIKTTTSK